MGQYLTALDLQGPVGDLVEQRGARFGDQQCQFRPMRPQLAKRPRIVECKRRRQPLERLVEQQEFMGDHQRAAKRDHFSLASGYATAGSFAHEAKLRQQRVNLVEPAPGLGLPQFQRQRRQADVVLDTQLGNEAPILRRIADPEPRAIMGWQPREVFGIETDDTAIERQKTHDRPQRGGFSSTIASDQDGGLARDDVAGHVAQHANTLDRDPNVIEVQHHATPTTLCRTRSSLKTSSGWPCAMILPAFQTRTRLA